MAVQKFVKPTNSLVRAYAVAAHGKSDKSKVTNEDRLAFLRDNPTITRRMLVEAGLPVGSRGVISASQFQAAADLIV